MAVSEVDLLSPLKCADVVTMPKDEALEKFNEYRNALGRAQNAADKIIMQCYKALSQGHGVLNVVEAIKKAGMNPDWTPKLAIMRADQERVFFRRASNNAGNFSYSERYYIARTAKAARATRLHFHLPEGTLKSPPSETRPWPSSYWHTHEAPLPLIPPQYRPSDALSKYCILWEVEKWTPREPPADPMLLKPLGQTGLYVVLAHWDLTPIERMVLGGLLGQ